MQLTSNTTNVTDPLAININPASAEMSTGNEPGYDLYKNRNIDWINGPFTKAFYLVMIIMVFLILHLSQSFTPEDIWMATNIIHGVLSFIFLHWIKGSPDDNNQGDYNGLTLFEQLDGGIPWTATKKFLMLIPTLLCWLACHLATYKPIYVVVNCGIFVICIIAKIPEMHRVRIFGINSSLGIDVPIEVNRVRNGSYDSTSAPSPSKSPRRGGKKKSS